MYIPTYVNMFWDIYEKIFPRLWSLDFAGRKHKFKRIANLIKIIALFTTIAVLGAATVALPWHGDEYDLYLPVKVAIDYFHNKYARNLYLFLFYTTFYHIGLTNISNLFCLTYLILHLHNQFCILIEKLKTLSNKKCQDLVTQELISCIKLHQTLLEYKGKLFLTTCIGFEFLGTLEWSTI